ncbi:MAG: hypothetical protein GY801_38805 [bacterium]|nr:hypothetical protein [bacterium]
MSLYPGAPRKENNEYFLDDKALTDSRALQDSMAKAIEDAMAEVYLKIKKEKLPEAGKEDRRMLFVAIARGILSYLQDHENELLSNVTIVHGTGSGAALHSVSNPDLNIQIDK